jgi:hypothetical protein
MTYRSSTNTAQRTAAINPVQRISHIIYADTGRGTCCARRMGIKGRGKQGGGCIGEAWGMADLLVTADRTDVRMRRAIRSNVDQGQC